MTVKIDNKIDGCENWSCDFNSFGAGDMSFSFDGETLLKSDGIELGILKELHGLEKICRSHYSDKTGWSWVETVTHHPFGSEPIIKRKWEQAANHIRVVSDIIIRGPLTLDHISIDPLKLPGKWKKVVIYSQLTPESSEIKVAELDVSDFLGKEKRFDHIPLVLLFVAEDGKELEIGTGYDLWRWHECASRFGGKSEFVLRGTDGGLSLERKVLVFDEDYEMQRNNFRFSWYFAWGKNKDNNKAKSFDKCNTLTVSREKLFSDNKTTDCVYSLDNSSLPDAVSIEGIPGIFPCFCSRQINNYLKQWLRSLYHKIKEPKKDIFLCDFDSHICLNASHLGRGKKKSSIHWDHVYLLGLWEWANKYLGDSSINFYILSDKNSKLANLPSFKGMGR